jgi:non-ribosomal peptide synthetase component F
LTHYDLQARVCRNPQGIAHIGDNFITSHQCLRNNQTTRPARGTQYDDLQVFFPLIGEAVAVARRSSILRELDELAKRLEEIVPSIGVVANGRGRGSLSCAHLASADYQGPGSSNGIHLPRISGHLNDVTCTRRRDAAYRDHDR